jgi:hypothetical protein
VFVGRHLFSWFCSGRVLAQVLVFMLVGRFYTHCCQEQGCFLSISSSLHVRAVGERVPGWGGVSAPGYTRCSRGVLASGVLSCGITQLPVWSMLGVCAHKFSLEMLS